MRGRSYWGLALLLVVSLFLGACAANNTPNVLPDESPLPDVEATPPADPEVPDDDVDPAPGEPVTIEIWHGYTETEEQTFRSVVEDFMAENPNITIDLLAVPFEELQTKFQTEAATGTGPTLTAGPQDRMAAYAQAGLLAPIPENEDFLNNIGQSSVDGARFDGELVGVPINSKVVSMFYNTSMVDAAPETMEELLEMAEEYGLAITSDWFHNYKWIPAFDAELFDDNFVCVLDETGAAEAFAYLDMVCDSPGVICDPNDGDMDTLFRQGEVAFRFQGPWMAGDAIADLGEENVAVAPIPTIEGQGDPQPWNQVEVLQINVNASQAEQDAALQFIGYMVSEEVQQTFLEQANWIPINENVDVSGNPVVGGFLEQVPRSRPFPVAAELGATWDPMGNAVVQVLEGVSTPEEAMVEACNLINLANDRAQ
jgi:arabinogalactan oligomer / maltooligosaccharide transport system substrate-binding protein